MHTQEQRTFRLDTVLKGEQTFLASFECREAISSPFQITVEFLTERPIEIKPLLGTEACITVQKDFTPAKVYFHGVFWSLKQRSRSREGLFAYEAEIVPSLRLLELNVRCRSFQKITVEEIVSAIFEQAKLKFRFDLSGGMPKREYCVQYRETDLNFVSRLLEEEGIFYFFEHSRDKHQLILTDKKAGLRACETGAAARFSPIPIALGSPNPVFSIEKTASIRPGAMELNDYNFTTPKLNLTATLDGAQTGKVFEYPGGYTTKRDGDRYVRIRLEEQEAKLTTFIGTGACAGFRSGHTFQLKEDPQREFNMEYLLVAIEHAGSNQSYRADSAAEGSSYSNTFRCIPSSAQYRPGRKIPKPVIQGAQTAVVTGPAGQEIYTDKYGRVQVRFFWNTAEQSCWMRVAQTWAGKSWGSLCLPRVGQEVVVEFLEGDPDRPLITGSVYNADQMPPYDLPGAKTRSGIRSHSSEGGAVSNCNEITFEDRKNEEALFIQAERDYHLNVKHDRRQDIGNDDGTVVKRDRKISVGADESISVGGSRSASVAKDDTLQVGSKFSVVAGQEISLTAPGGSIVIGEEGITIQSAGTIVVQGSLVKIN